MLFRGLLGFRNTAEKCLNASLLLMSLKPLTFPKPYGLDVLSHPVKAWASRNRGDRTHLGYCTTLYSVRKNGKIQFRNNFFIVCYYWCPLQSSKFLCISDYYFVRYERNKKNRVKNRKFFHFFYCRGDYALQIKINLRTLVCTLVISLYFSIKTSFFSVLVLSQFHF